MSYMHERVSYLRGLSEGLDIDLQKKEGKLLNAIVDVLEDFADQLEIMEEMQEEIAGTVDDILEDEFDDEDEDDDIEYFEIICDNCGNKVCIDENLLDSEEGIICPVCDKAIEIEIDHDYDCDGCK